MGREVKDTVEAFYRSLSNKNLKAIDAVWGHEPYSTVVGPYGTVRQGWTEVAAYWAQRLQDMAGERVTIRLTKMNCHVVGDVAWLSGVERRTFTSEDETRTEDLRVTCVMERKGTGWQIVSYHASLPSDEPVSLASAS
jgi:ketosteroid isomerase-like protein